MDEMAIRESGYKEGIEEGMKEGAKERNIEIAKTMKNKKISLELISEITGIDIELLKKL